MRQDPFTGRIGDRPLPWGSRIAYTLLDLLIFGLPVGFFRS